MKLEFFFEAREIRVIDSEYREKWLEELGIFGNRKVENNLNFRYTFIKSNKYCQVLPFYIKF